MNFLEDITLQHSQIARTIWEKKSRLTPKIWAQGLHQMIVAEPLHDQAVRDTTDEYRATLAIAMAVKIDALVLGRSDEAFIKTASAESLVSGSLRRIADVDPEVRSCVVTEAVLVGGSEEITIVAAHGLDDYGRHEWTVTRSVNGTMRSLVPLQVARDMIADGLPDFWKDPIALEQFADQIRWQIQVFPEASI